MGDEKELKIKIKGTDTVISQKTILAQTMKDRMIGLMFSKDIPRGDGLLISPCNSIHTFFMRYPIDVVFLDKNNIVVKFYRSLKAWRITPLFFRSNKVLELRAGTLPRDFEKGLELEVISV